MLRALLILPLMLASVTAAPAPYHLLKEIPVGGEGGWDYLSCDPAAHRLYVTHATKVVVIDTQKDAVVGEITDTPGVHGFAIAPDLGLGFSSNGKEAKASIVDLKTLKTLSKVDTGEDPDCILYTSGEHEVYTFNGDAKTATVFDAKTGKVTATIPLPGDPEFAVYDPATDMVYNNIADKQEIVAINAKTHLISHTCLLVEGKPTGLALDTDSHHLFVGCRKLEVLKMLSCEPIGFLAMVSIHSGNDACAFDPATHLAFASTKEGFVTIAREAGDKLEVVQNLVTEPGARTMTLDPQTHRIYLTSAKFEPLPPNSPPGTRPKIIPNTFKILVYGM